MSHIEILAAFGIIWSFIVGFIVGRITKPKT